MSIESQVIINNIIPNGISKNIPDDTQNNTQDNTQDDTQDDTNVEIYDMYYFPYNEIDIYSSQFIDKVSKMITNCFSYINKNDYDITLKNIKAIIPYYMNDIILHKPNLLKVRNIFLACPDTENLHLFKGSKIDNKNRLIIDCLYLYLTYVLYKRKIITLTQTNQNYHFIMNTDFNELKEIFSVQSIKKMNTEQHIYSDYFPFKTINFSREYTEKKRLIYFTHYMSVLSCLTKNKCQYYFIKICGILSNCSIEPRYVNGSCMTDKTSARVAIFMYIFNKISKPSQKYTKINVAESLLSISSIPVNNDNEYNNI